MAYSLRDCSSGCSSGCRSGIRSIHLGGHLLIINSSRCRYHHLAKGLEPTSLNSINQHLHKITSTGRTPTLNPTHSLRPRLKGEEHTMVPWSLYDATTSYAYVLTTRFSLYSFRVWDLDVATMPRVSATAGQGCNRQAHACEAQPQASAQARPSLRACTRM